jgi:pilus assembly protein CpaE
MLRAIIIGADDDLKRQLEGMFYETGRFGLIRSLDGYPDEHTIERMMRAHAPETVFLCVDELDSALRVRTTIEQTVSGMPVVAFGRTADQDILMELMKHGVREFLPVPFESQRLLDLGDRVEESLTRNPLAIDSTDLMFSFLPSKPGVGTSTLALNIAVALSRFPDTRTLLTDFDLNSGLTAFMLKLATPHSIVDAVVRSEDLDENLWPQLVAKVKDLDVLPAGRPEPGVRIQPLQIQRMLNFARRQYDVICADLSGNMEKYSIELMMESKRIFVVATPEIPPLHLARQRLNFLREIDLRDRVSVLLNRWTKKSAISVNQIEDLLDAPVYESFPNNYVGVHKALVEGKPVDEASDLGKKCQELARRIMKPKARDNRPNKRSFLQSFSILPSKYSMGR